MTSIHPMTHCLLRGALLAGVCFIGSAVAATTATPAKPAAAAPSKAAGSKPAKSSAAAKKAPAKPVEVVPAEASTEQIEAAERVYYGVYECEFNQTVDIEKNAKHAAYVNVKSGKSAWVMKPVVSQTGAIRLEDVKGETLMVQIASKSMLLNVKTARRIVDDCVSPKQRELIEAAKVATAEAMASGAPAATPLLQAPGSAPATPPNDAASAVK